MPGSFITLTVAHGEADSGFEIHSRRASRGYQHATFVPADMPVSGYFDGIRSVRELRMSFPPALHTRLSADRTRLALKIPEREWQAFIQGHTNGFVTKTVEKLRYNGAAGTVSVELRTRQGSRS
jgi:hypothetical protein